MIQPHNRTPSGAVTTGRASDDAPAGQLRCLMTWKVGGREHWQGYRRTEHPFGTTELRLGLRELLRGLLRGRLVVSVSIGTDPRLMDEVKTVMTGGPGGRP